VICAYTVARWRELVDAVRSVQAQSHPPVEIIVVVDGNEELFGKASAELDGAKVVRNEHSPGLSGGRNTGVDHATGSTVVFLDDDAVAEPHWLGSLLSVYDDPTVLGAGGGVVPLWRETRPEWFPKEFNWVLGCSYTGMPETVAEIRNPIGANLSIRRDVFLAAGGFERALARVTGVNGVIGTGTADETEFCIRASLANPGGRWIYVPDARVHHVVPANRATWSYFVSRCQMEGASKAVLTGLAGTQEGLASERRYVRSILPRAILRELALGVRGNRAALGRAGSIVAGLGITAAAYLRGRAKIRLRGGRTAA